MSGDKEDKGKEAEKPKKMTARTLQPGANQKCVIITTDGANVNLDPKNLNLLELEMILIKSLEFIRKRK